ncbi:MAG: heavy-metal-associated domain-containing protein [Cellulomonas iranensis]|uniref:heavy-metal-associated domain-containing protein n=1 Tax=Cellulomonas iranensis TaxID=76862 RepID=UPI001B07CDB8|nr:heavy-metal-associated domain-containing protein [Cellulomonas iranensis]MBO9568834.1 heavy-metal-associated domain-containing protein [Cellulomonas iranensis]
MATTTFRVDGMTCGNCVKHVTEELTALPGVTDVTVELVSGGASPVTVTSDAPLDDAAVAAAVEEAGYAVTPARSLL